MIKMFPNAFDLGGDIGELAEGTMKYMRFLTESMIPVLDYKDILCVKVYW